MVCNDFTMLEFAGSSVCPYFVMKILSNDYIETLGMICLWPDAQKKPMDYPPFLEM